MIRVKHRVLCPKDGRYYLVLDPAEIYPDDPGNGTPVMVYFDFAGVHHASATYSCAIGEGELMQSGCGTWVLPSEVYEWLEGLHEYVEQFLAPDGGPLLRAMESIEQLADEAYGQDQPTFEDLDTALLYVRSVARDAIHAFEHAHSCGGAV